MLIEINEIDVKEFLDWVNRTGFCNSGQHICDRLVTIFESTPAKPQHGREPDKVKPLAQYLAEYVDAEIENGNISPDVAELYAYNSWRELLEQALNAYESTENVTIKIERI